MWVSKREYKLLESELEFYRHRSMTLERENARLHDALLLANGSPPVSDVVRTERRQDRDEAKAELDDRQRQMAEIFGQTLHDVAAELPEELRAELGAELQ